MKVPYFDLKDNTNILKKDIETRCFKTLRSTNIV